MTVQERILKALSRGPLYEGVLPLIVGASDVYTLRVLRRLELRGRVRRNGYTWYLA